MPRSTSFEMGLPPFRGAVRQIILASTAIYIVLLLMYSFAQNLAVQILPYGILSPEGIRHGWIWQFVTYGFIYLDPLDFALTMLSVYFIGNTVEDRVGARRFYSLYFSGLAIAGLAGFLLSLTHSIAQGSTAGAGAAANAILM